MSDKDKFKFSSSFLKRPFSNTNATNEELKEDPIQEKLEIENDSQMKETSKINNHDNTYSLSDQRPQTSYQFNESNNLSISSSTMTNNKKRRPFENLTFYSDAKKENNISLNNNNERNENIKNNNEEKNDLTESEVQFKDILNESETIFNTSTITDNEKSMIMSSYKLISKDTIEKAKKFNKEYKSTPFWIKFFEEIENGSLKNNSSYFKINNKNEYIKNLVEMIQRDADIYEKSLKSKETRQETEKELKQLLEENNSEQNESSIKNNSKNVSSNNVSNISSSKNKSNNKNENENKNEKDKELLTNKFNQILDTFNKLDEKEKKIYNAEDDYETFKFKLITGGKFNADRDKEIEKIPSTIKKLENLEDIKEKPMTEKEKKKDEILKLKGIKEFKTIDELYFPEDYTYEELNYDKIDFFAYNKDSLKKLLALDKKLHEIDPVKYNTSINTELKKIQDEFNLGKEERMKKADKEIRALFNKYQAENKETRKTIFDVKQKDESKPKYIDYLHNNDEIKKERKELKMKLNNLDEKIKDIYNKEIPKEKLDKLNKEIEDYHQTDEYKQKFENLNIPGYSFLNNIKRDIIDIENKNHELIQGLSEVKNLLEIEAKKSNKEEIEKFKKEIVEPFYDYKTDLNKAELENKNDFDKVKKLEEDMNKEEEVFNNIQKNLDDLNNNKNKYEEMFEEADKIIMEHNNNNDDKEKNEYNSEEVIKKYGIDGLVDEQKENENLINNIDNQLKDFGEKLKLIHQLNDEVENEGKNLMSPEEFAKMPEEVAKYLKEKELEEKENKENDKKKLEEIMEEKELLEEGDKILEEENKKNNEEEGIKIEKSTFEEISNDSLEIDDDKKENNGDDIIKDSLEIDEKDK